MSVIFDHIDLQQQKSKRDRIVDGILDAIQSNALSKGDPLPSVNKFMQRLGFARMTVVKALNILKEKGVIVARDKVGYFVKDVNYKKELKVFLFLSGFNYYHEVLYNSIIDRIKHKDIIVDLYFHHCNPKVFKSILMENLGSYSLYVITGFDNPQVYSLLSRIPPKKLLQIIRTPLLGDNSSIHQDFYGGLKRSMANINFKLSKYERFVLIFPQSKIHPDAIKSTFLEFCRENNINHKIENEVRRESVQKGSAFWVIEDSDMIELIKAGEEKGFTLGKEIGILSYNETPMKEFIRNGITVISANFTKMGEAISGFIFNPEHTIKIFEPEIIIRNSL